MLRPSSYFVQVLSYSLCITHLLCYAQPTKDVVTIKIGILLPLSVAIPSSTTTDSQNRTYQDVQNMRQFSEFAVNISTILQPNIRVEFLEIDFWRKNTLSFNPSTSTNAGSAAVRVIKAVEATPNLIAVYGGFSSAAAIASASVLSQYKIPMCGDLQASPALSNKNEFPYYFRIYSGLGIHKHIYLLLKAWGVRRVAILVGNDQFNRQTATDMIQLLGVNGIKILQVVHVGPVFQKSTLNALKIVDARYILTFVATASLSNIYFHCKDLIGPKYVWIGVDNPSSSNPTDLEQQLLQGFILVTPKNVGNRTLLNDRFAPGSELDFSAPVGAFDCINTLLYGIASLLQSNASFTPKMLATRKLQRYLKPVLFSNTHYHGAYQDPIILDPITGDLIIPYSFLDFLNSEDIAFTDSNATQIFFTNYAFKFNGGSTIPPPDGPPILSAAIEIDSYEGFLLILLIVSGLALSVICATLLVMFRLNKIFVKSAPIFSGLIIVGSFLAYASIGLLLGKPTAIICHLRLWFQVIGFSIAITAFLVKNYRIHMIFSSRTIIPKSKLSNERFGGFLVNFILIEILLLIAWSVLTNPKPSREDEYNQQNSFQCISTAPDPKYDQITTVLLYTYNSLLLVLTTLLAYLTRSVNSDYNESLFMFFFVIAASLTAGTTVNAVNDESGTRPLIIRSAATWIFTTFTLLTFFVPKTVGVYCSYKTTEMKRLSDIISDGKKSSGRKRRSSLYPASMAVVVKPGWKLPTLPRRGKTTSSRSASLGETRVTPFGSSAAATSSATVICSNVKSDSVKFSLESVAKPCAATARIISDTPTIADKPRHARSVSSLCPLPSASLPRFGSQGRIHKSNDSRRTSFDILTCPQVGSYCESLHSLTARYRYEVLGRYEFEINRHVYKQWGYGEIMIHSVGSKVWLSVEICGYVDCFVVTNIDNQITLKENSIFVRETSRFKFPRVLRIELDSDIDAQEILKNVKSK